MSKELANLLYPSVKETVADYEIKYPPRENLPENAWVARFAPSPTGFVHIGSLLVSLINRRLVSQSGGIYYLRIEDTDKNREVEDGPAEIVKAMRNFEIDFDEGPPIKQLEGKSQKYGPYLQSERLGIYQVFAKHLVEIGRAYPCFCTSEELDAIRQEQENQKVRPGYYGSWAKHRNMDVQEAKQKIENGEKFVLRLKSMGDVKQKINHLDLVKGSLTLSENDLDTVLIKSDGFPTYHFAHVVDDHLMRTNLVLRGDEWLPSVPLHLELFNAFGFTPPKYAHIAPIMKIDNGSQRKLSKRKDPEANVDYYLDAGYPVEGVLDYLLNLANSTFDDWRRLNAKASNEDFELKISKIGKSGALFDLGKFDNMCKNRIGEMSGDQIYEEIMKWSQKNDPQFYEIIMKDSEYAKKVFGIEKQNQKARKDLVKWSEARGMYGYFWDEIYSLEVTQEFESVFTGAEQREIRERFAAILKEGDPKEIWFEKFQSLVQSLNCATDLRSYKQDPDSYKGHIGDVAMVIRVALTKRKNTPDLHEMIGVMGLDRVKNRLL